jgi:hypothetical protein
MISKTKKTNDIRLETLNIELEIKGYPDSDAYTRVMEPIPIANNKCENEGYEIEGILRLREYHYYLQEAASGFSPRNIHAFNRGKYFFTIIQEKGWPLINILYPNNHWQEDREISSYCIPTKEAVESIDGDVISNHESTERDAPQGSLILTLSDSSNFNHQIPSSQQQSDFIDNDIDEDFARVDESIFLPQKQSFKDFLLNWRISEETTARTLKGYIISA